jgi:hypothetical protein
MGRASAVAPEGFQKVRVVVIFAERRAPAGRVRSREPGRRPSELTADQTANAITRAGSKTDDDNLPDASHI